MTHFDGLCVSRCKILVSTYDKVLDEWTQDGSTLNNIIVASTDNRGATTDFISTEASCGKLLMCAPLS